MIYKEWNMETIECIDGTCLVSSDDSIFSCNSSVETVDQDIDTIMNVLPGKLVTLIDENDDIALIASVGMIDKAWQDLCVKNIKERAGFISKSFINSFEKKLYSALLRRFCQC